MRFYAQWPWYAMTSLCLAGLALPTSQAGEPTPVAARMPSWVVVKPGTEPPKAPRPVEPTSFVVDVGNVSEGERVPIKLEIRNTSAATIRIVGGTSGCSRQGCYAIKGTYPVAILPGSVGTVTIEYKAPLDAKALEGRSSELEASIYIGATTTFALPYRIRAEVTSRKAPPTAD